jgi:Transposase DDE domain group 1
MTQCNQRQFAFAPHFSRQVVVGFEDRRLSTEGGALLLRETDRKIGLLSRRVGCFVDHRDPERIEHPLRELLAQRIYGLALGSRRSERSRGAAPRSSTGLAGGQAERGGALGGQEYVESPGTHARRLAPGGSPVKMGLWQKFPGFGQIS